MRLTVEVNLRDHAYGPLRAEVILVQYADFECPYSKRANAAIKDVTGWYGNLVCIVFRHFPKNDKHTNEWLAAEAAEAAASQGMFWEMQDCLFSNQQLLDRHHLLRYARMLELDVDRFGCELNEGIHRGRVEQDLVVELSLASARHQASS